MDEKEPSPETCAVVFNYISTDVELRSSHTGKAIIEKCIRIMKTKPEVFAIAVNGFLAKVAEKTSTIIKFPNGSFVDFGDLSDTVKFDSYRGQGCHSSQKHSEESSES